MKKLLLILSIVLTMNTAQAYEWADLKEKKEEVTQYDFVKLILGLTTEVLTMKLDEIVKQKGADGKITISVYDDNETLGFTFDLYANKKISRSDCFSFLSDVEGMKGMVSEVFPKMLKDLTYREIKSLEDSFVIEANLHYRGDTVTCRN